MNNFVQGPIILGVISPGTKSKSKLSNIIDRVQGGLLSASFAGIVGLSLGALVHHQVNSLPWGLVAFVPPIFLALSSSIFNKINPPDEKVVASLDWLKQQTLAGKFGQHSKKFRALVWITAEGLFTSNQRFFDWTRFLRASFENDQRITGSSLYRLTLKVMDTDESGKVIVQSTFAIMILSVAVCLRQLFVEHHRYGMRDDVLALSAAVLFEVMLIATFFPVFVRANRFRHSASELAILIDSQSASVDDVISLLHGRVPVE